MKILTLIPNASTYGVMLLIVLSLGSFNIARHIHIRWFSHQFTFVGSNAIVKSALAMSGLLIIPVTSLFSDHFISEIYSLLLGILFGVFTVLIEIKMLRKINRQNLINKNHKYVIKDDDVLRNAKIINKLSLSTAKKINPKGLAHVRQGYKQYATKPDFLNYSLTAVIIVGIAEEFLFRGYLISIAKLMPNYLLSFFIITSSIFLFAFSHMVESWDEFKYKLPLSFFTTAGFIATGSLISAIATHLILNVYAYQQKQKLIVEDWKGYSVSSSFMSV